jgi:quercetin dioxygenase-like cupin family protein
MRPIVKRALGIAPGVIILGVFAAVALGSPGSGVTTPPDLVARAELDPVHLNSDRIKFHTKGPAAVRVQTLDFAPGAYTGWHHHPGFVIVAVKEGEVTVFDSDCNGTPYPAGTAFVEYGDDPREVRNRGTVPAKVYATYVAPSATPPVWRLEDPVQNCR